MGQDNMELFKLGRIFFTTTLRELKKKCDNPDDHTNYLIIYYINNEVTANRSVTELQKKYKKYQVLELKYCI